MIVTTDHTRRCRKFSELIIVKFEIPSSTTTTFCVSVDALVLTAIFRQQQVIYFPKVAEVEVTLHNFSKQLFFPFQWLFQVDISSQSQMSDLKGRLQSLPDVAGIIHAAMVLRDEYIKDLTFQSFNEVMGPKIKGKTATEVI